MKIFSVNIRSFGGAIKWGYLNEVISKEVLELSVSKKLKSLQNEKCYTLWGLKM